MYSCVRSVYFCIFSAHKCVNKRCEHIESYDRHRVPEKKGKEIANLFNALYELYHILLISPLYRNYFT